MTREQTRARPGAAPTLAAAGGPDEFLELLHGLDAIVWEMDARTWRFLFVSQRAEHILGYPVSRWLEEPTFWQDILLHPDDRGWALDYCSTATRELRDHEFLYRARAADGRIVWLKDLVRVVPGPDGEAATLRGVMVNVTDEVEADRARARVVDMIERVTDAFFALDRDWRFTYVNREAERVLDRRRADLLGQSVWDAFPEAVGSRFWEEYHAAVSGGETRTFTEFYPPLDRWFDVRAYPSPDGLSIYFQDVTARRRMEAQLRESRRQIETMALNATQALFIMDEQQHCTYMNPAAEQLTGFSLDEVQGRPLHDILHHTRPDGSAYPLEECPIDQALPQRMREQGEEVFVHKDGSFYPVAFTASPLMEDGRPVGTIIEVRNITDELRAREETAQRDREAALTMAVGEAITGGGTLSETLQQCAAAVVDTLDAAFARIWTLNDAEQVLELQASAGLYTHLDGPHGTVPVGRFKIGLIAEERRPHLTNDVQSDERVSDKAWAKREGMVSFAGYPLLVDGRLVGVLALFARKPLPERTLNALGAVSDAIATTILRKEAEAERERLVRELESERRRLFEAFMQAPVAISVTEGPDHRVVVQNEMSRAIAGRDIIGLTAREVLPELEGQGLFEIIDEVYRTGTPWSAHGLEVAWDRDGDGALETGYFDVFYQPLRDSTGRTYALLSMSVEVTEQVRVRAEIEARAAELARTAAALERSNAELDQFAYVASHDLKAPLRGIANLAQWLEEDLEGRLSGDSAEHMRLLHGRVQRMDALIDGILSYSRAGRVRESVEQVDTGRLVEESIDLLSPPPTAEVVVQDSMPALRAERTALQQVFLNLISNALKYTLAHREDARVTIEWERTGDMYRFSISDNGPGIAPEFHDRVWGIFQTLEARDKVEGTGVGLSVVRKIVETRGGSVSLESATGAGATFGFTWPATPNDG
ncbi:MAG TPA: PAS domain-containing protein [Longimicrobiales bacterium]|nr:PAS domain-containing protein [Longimicrobiales bacterium]